ncbi:coiled-coil domain-containing protein [Sesbania bispinosa]|nr:coiled-coil domain-containing protein [Sesbania bispinosa]
MQTVGVQEEGQDSRVRTQYGASNSKASKVFIHYTASFRAHFLPTQFWTGSESAPTSLLQLRIWVTRKISASTRMETQTPGTEGTSGDASINQASIDESNSRMEGFIKEELNCVLNEKELAEGQEKELINEVTVRTSEVEHLEEELELMRAAAEMAFNNQHSVDFYLDQLNEKVQAKMNYLLTLESEWDEEHSRLIADMEKQQKLASRKSYTHRIKEITKNSQKQDADIQRILKETREVQLESNSIQERLHRTYGIADEIVFREVKKDPTGLQKRNSENEMKLAATASRSLDVSELQADLDPLLGKLNTLDNITVEKALDIMEVLNVYMSGWWSNRPRGTRKCSKSSSPSLTQSSIKELNLS